MRRVLAGADEILLGVAFVQQRGINLLEQQLKSVETGRLVTTTVFGSTTRQGLGAAQAGGLGVRVINPSRGTFHPKLYLGRHGNRIAAAIGSANLTSGLVANVEVAVVLHGDHRAPRGTHSGPSPRAGGITRTPPIGHQPSSLRRRKSSTRACSTESVAP